MSAVEIRDIQATDEAQWHTLWEAYNTFYKRSVPHNVTKTTFQRILSSEVKLFGAVAVDTQRPEGESIVGFVIWLPHIYTATVEDIVYLHDLYVNESIRNAGIGRKLIEYVYDQSRKAGYASVYWHTQHFNHRAQLLYTKVADKTDFVQYKHSLK